MVPNLGDMETHSHSYTFAHNMKLELQFVYLIQNTSQIREARDLNFSSFYDFSIGFWKCSYSVESLFSI
jgi:hypothetical protein